MKRKYLDKRYSSYNDLIRVRLWEAKYQMYVKK
jgi:hypothetical protein